MTREEAERGKDILRQIYEREKIQAKVKKTLEAALNGDKESIKDLADWSFKLAGETIASLEHELATI